MIDPDDLNRREKTTPPSSVSAESIPILTEEYVEAVARLLGGKE